MKSVRGGGLGGAVSAVFPGQGAVSCRCAATAACAAALLVERQNDAATANQKTRKFCRIFIG